MTAISIEHLSKFYGTNMGIKDISFEVAKGEAFGFIGPNGAGKSTTIKILMGIIAKSGGTARIFDEECTLNSRKVREKIGYLSSDCSLYRDMRVIDILKYAADVRGVGRDRINELSERLRLDLNKKFSQLSLGNKKKAGLVNAIMHSPELIILDEPTSGLDPFMQQVFIEILNEEMARGATLLLSSHMLSEVQALCNRIAIIKNGEIIKIATIDELTAGRADVKIVFSGTVPEIKLEGAGEAIVKDKSVSFSYTGETPKLYKYLAGIKSESIFVVPINLNEAVAEYYRMQ